MSMNRRTFILVIERSSRMKMSRRAFLVGAGVFTASPALASLLSADYEVAPALPALPAAAAHGTDLVFKIDGWSVQDSAARNEIWFSVNRSWRAAWR
jgi:hypothetical protein